MGWGNPFAASIPMDALHKQIAELQERIRLLEERQKVLGHPRCRGDHVSCKWPLVAALADAENAVVESAEKLGIKVDGMHEEAVKAYAGQVEERIRLLEQKLDEARKAPSDIDAFGIDHAKHWRDTAQTLQGDNIVLIKQADELKTAREAWKRLAMAYHDYIKWGDDDSDTRRYTALLKELDEARKAVEKYR